MMRSLVMQKAVQAIGVLEAYHAEAVGSVAWRIELNYPIQSFVLVCEHAMPPGLPIEVGRSA